MILVKREEKLEKPNQFRGLLVIGVFSRRRQTRVASLKRTPKRIPDWENEAPLPHK
jgi:hypothetical protein